MNYVCVHEVAGISDLCHTIPLDYFVIIFQVQK